MNKTIFSLILFLAPILLLSQEETYSDSIAEAAIDTLQFYDGPYIFINEGKLIEKTVVNEKVMMKEVPMADYPIEFKPEKSTYKNVPKIAALSDIHG